MDVERVFQKLRPVMGARLDELWQAYLLSDPKTRALLEASLRAQLASLGSTFEDAEILLAPPPPEKAAGEIPLGTVHYAGKPVCEFGLRLDELCSHTLIAGRTGTGKTNVCFLLLSALAEKRVPFLVFDWKRNYRDLLGLPGFEGLEVFTVGRSVAPFAFNPLRPPPGTEPRVHIKKCIEIACHAYYLGEGVEYLLQEAFDAVYAKAGVYDGGDRWPTMADVRDWLLAYRAKGRQAAWMDSALRAVGVLCFGEMGRVLNAPRPMEVERLLERNVVLELDGLSNSDKVFLIESLLLWVHHYRLAQQGRERLKHVVVVEEAHHILLRKKQEATGEEAVTDVILREIRELGVGVVILDQHVSLITKPALAEPATTLALNQKHRGDLTMLADSLLLDREEAKVLGRLGVGWGLVKLQDRWHRPFLVLFRHFAVEKGRVTDDELRARFGAIASQAAPSEFVASSRARSDFVTSSATPGAGALVPAGAEGGKKEVEEGMLRLLRDVVSHRISTIPLRFSRLSLSTGSGERLLSSAVARGLLTSTYVRTPQGRARWLELTEAGSRALGVPFARSPREGGPEHRYWVARTAAWLASQGYAVEREVAVAGGFVDLVGTKGGERVAVEVETGRSDAAANVLRLRGAGFDRVLVVALSEGVRRAVEVGVGADIRAAMRVSLAAPRDVAS